MDQQVKRSHAKRNWIITIVIVILLAGGGAAAYFIVHKNSTTSTSLTALMNEGLTAQTNGNVTLASADYQKVISLNPDNKKNLTTYAYYNLGVINTAEGNTSVAIGYYTQAIDSDPKYLPALFNLAVVETSTNPSGALSEYNAILAIKPTDANTLFNAGLLNNQLGNVAIAKEEVKAAIKEVPSLASRVPKSFPSLK
jgi:tetratricopeptide (TPR) repeat protein